MLRIVTGIIFLAFQGAANADNADWSFDQHPVPLLQDLSIEDRLLVMRAYPIRGDASAEHAIDRFKPLYAQLYPSAPAIPDGTLLESRFLRHLTQTQSYRGFGQALAGATRERLRERASQYHRTTGRSICSLRIPDPADWPFLVEALQTVETGLRTGEWVYPLFGASLAEQQPEIDWAAELDVFIQARTDLGFGNPIESVGPEDVDGSLSVEAIASIHDAARRGDLDFVLDMVGACWAR